MNNILLFNGEIINEGKRQTGSIYIKNGLIEDIYFGEVPVSVKELAKITDVSGKIIIPGIIDDQVHFREPGLTHKAEIYTESKAAIAGGVTSFMEMPNTNPQTTTQELLEQKYETGAQKSLANYSFYIGATNDNLEELLKTDPKRVCGIKIFMGASTGNMLVDNPNTLDHIFEKSPVLIAVHCEDEPTIRRNLAIYSSKYGDDIPVVNHPEIRSEEACYLSSSLAINLAKKYGTRLHVLHISTAKELSLFSNEKTSRNKQITSEACVHHMWFDDSDYEKLGNKIKWNPAIKSKSDKEQIFKALFNDIIDVIATDHAPHTLEEKSNLYTKAPSGGPLVQHSLNVMLEFYNNGKISLEKIVEKMCHHPAEIFQVSKRGYLRKGYFADIAVIDPNITWTVGLENILYKCKWSPLEGQTFKGKVTQTYVNGNLVYDNGNFNETYRGMRLEFDR